MAALLSAAKCKQKAAGGKPNTLSVEDQLLMMLEYWREYGPIFISGKPMGGAESAAYRNIKGCESTLAKSKAFRLPGRKAVAASKRAFDIVLIDVTETPIERPKKQRRYYSGKKKRHTLKTQLVVEKSTRRILCLAHDQGRRHDFRLFKTSNVHLHPEKKGRCRQRLSRLAETTCQHGDAKKAQQKESLIRKRQGQKPRHIQRARVS
jgi:DDE superfamily endonuclease